MDNDHDEYHHHYPYDPYHASGRHYDIHARK
jgi:hypothetical protein